MSLKVFSRVLALVAILVGGCVLLGWIFDVPTLKSILPSWVTMKVNTALAFVLAGLSLGILVMERSHRILRNIALVCAGMVVMIGMLTFCQYLFGWNLGIDQLLFRESFTAVGTSSPGRMAPNTALNFLMIGVALVLLHTSLSIRIAQLLAVATGLIGLLGLIGYAYGVKAFYGISSYTKMAIHTALVFIFLSIGLLFARPSSGLMVVVTSDTMGGLTVRRLLPAAIGVPFLLGWLSLLGEQAGLYSTEFGLALFVALNIIILTLLVWINAVLLQRVDMERKQVEEERDRFFRLSIDMMCTADFNGYFKQLNPAFEKTLGYTREELLARPYLEFVHPDDRTATGAEAGKIAGGATTLYFENRYLCRNGSYKWLAWTAVPYPEEKLIYAVARDVTERKYGEERFRVVVEAAPIAMIMVDKNGKITLVNSQTESLFGYTRNELLGQQIELLVPERFRSKHIGDRGGFFTDPRRRLMGAGRGLYGLHRNGSEVPIEIGLNPVSMEKGVFVLASIIDISERKQAEAKIFKLNEELRVSNKELESFSYSVSHDLRAPLRSIDGFSKVLLEDYENKLDEEGKNSLQRVRAASQKMAQLIDGMLALSRVTRSELRMEQVNLSLLAGEVSTDLRKTGPERRAEFIIASGVTAYGDPTLLRVVLQNLLGNAWKFTEKHTKATIEFGVAAKDGSTLYYVRDDGAGFDMKYVSKLFGAFQRLHGVAEFDGTGIGLATVERIIHLHKGRIWAEGQVEQGATFYFTLGGANE